MALRAPHLHRMHPSTTAIAAIVFVTLVLSGFISYSVADGFNRYDEAIAVIRAQRLVLEDLLSQETSLQGYLDTGNRALLAPYRKSTATTAQDIDQLDRDIETLHLTMSDLLIDRIRETYREWDSNVKNLLLARPTADTFRQERLRRLMDSMRADLGRIQDEDRIFQDRVIRQVRLTVVGGSMALLLTIVLLGSLGIVAENARRRELHQLNVELDSRNQELERSNAALADFAYVASHDLQEPLRTVASYTQLLKKRYASELGIEGAEFVEFATNAAHRMERLINDLLEYSLVTMARTFENVESASALETAMHNLSVRIEEHRARVECSVLPPVFANPGQLAIVFQNLLS
ncbi:MAG TPA: histidine kinase dimerization/phospho-acceptor domain-containing protein, partial [Candidatus Acidoferrales bacterium]|nr:histidine kinase dimerization/phospho-acceptor domain-containing protein [Candidatus Acidoferrales bacterium]